MRANDFKAKRDKRASVATQKIEKELKKAEKRKKNFTKDDQLSRLQKYEEGDKKNKYYKPFQGDPNFRGPKAKRRTTDKPFIPVFFALNILFFIYAIFAYKDGVFDRLSRGLDFRGEICGVGKLESRPYLYFANPVIDINVKFCVDKCPKYSGALICLYDVDPEIITPFCYTQIQSTTSGRYCLPVEPVNKRIVDEELSTPGNVIRKAAADITMSADVIFTGSIISIAIAYLFFELMRRQTRTKIIVWLSIVGCAVFLFATALFFRFEYLETIEARCLLGVDKYGCGGLKASVYKVLQYVCAALGVVYVILVIKMRRQMYLGLRLVQLAGEVLSFMLQVRFLPFILIAISLVVGIIFITCLALAFSVGTIMEVDARNIDGDRVYVIDYSLPMRILSVFFYLLFQWWINLILLTVDAIVSYCISVWFFEKKKETVVLDLPKIAKIIFSRHMGTVALIAISKLIFKIQATFLETLRKTLRKAKQHSNFVRFWQACCLCCVHVHQRFYRYISKHALVQTCIWGDPFKSASQKSFFLLRRHQEQVKNMDSVSTYILFQTKFFCSLLGGVFVYAYLFMFTKTIFGRDLSDLDSFAVPAVVSVLLGFFYATTFQGLFDIAIKAVVQCFLMDTEMFVGDQKYVVGLVRDFMESYKIEANKKELKVQEVKDKMAKGGKIVPGIFIEHIDAEDKKDEESGIYSEETSKESGSEDDSEEDDSDEDGSGSEEEGSDEEDDDDEDEDDDEEGSEEDEDEDEEADTTNRSHLSHLTSTSQHHLMKSQVSLKAQKGAEANKSKFNNAKKQESEEDEDDDEEDEDEDESEEVETPAKKGGNQKSEDEDEEDDDDEEEADE